MLAPPFPPTPATVLNRIPGLLGHVDAENHNVYEDYPVVGIAYQGCVEKAAGVLARTYASAAAPGGAVANRNLQGFDTLKTVRED